MFSFRGVWGMNGKRKGIKVKRVSADEYSVGESVLPDRV